MEPHFSVLRRVMRCQPARFPHTRLMLQAYLPSDTQSLQVAIRRELYSFTLYRLLEAALVKSVCPSWHDFWPAGAPALGCGHRYCLPDCRHCLVLQWPSCQVNTQVWTGISLTILASTLATNAPPNVGSGIAMMLLFNIGAAALSLPRCARG